MIYDEIQEALRTVGDINSTIYEHTDEWLAPVIAETDGSVVFVSWAGSQIWRSDEDERDFDEEANEWEPLRGFLIRKIREHLDDLNRVTACLFEANKPTPGWCPGCCAAENNDVGQACRYCKDVILGPLPGCGA